MAALLRSDQRLCPLCGSSPASTILEGDGVLCRREVGNNCWADVDNFVNLRILWQVNCNVELVFVTSYGRNYQNTQGSKVYILMWMYSSKSCIRLNNWTLSYGDTRLHKNIELLYGNNIIHSMPSTVTFNVGSPCIISFSHLECSDNAITLCVIKSSVVFRIWMLCLLHSDSVWKL